MLGTGLSRAQRTQFSRVAALIHARVATDMSPEVTHLITGSALSSTTSADDGKKGRKRGPPVASTGVTCPRTLKFLFAVLQVRIPPPLPTCVKA